MKKFIVVLILLSSTALAADIRQPTVDETKFSALPPETHGQIINEIVTKSLGEYYVQTLDLQLTLKEQVEELSRLKIELDKCHKEGCKQEPSKK